MPEESVRDESGKNLISHGKHKSKADITCTKLQTKSTDMDNSSKSEAIKEGASEGLSPAPHRKKRDKSVGPIVENAKIEGSSRTPLNVAKSMPGKDWYLTTQNSKRKNIARQHSKLSKTN